MTRRIHAFAIGAASLAVAAALAAGCSSRVVKKEDIEAKQRADAQAAAAAEAQRQAAADARWRGPTVAWLEPFELRGGNEIKLEGADYRVALLKTSWVSMQTPKGETRKGTAKLLITRGEEMKEVTIDEGSSKTVLGHRVEVQLAHEDYVQDRAIYEPLARLVVHRQ